MKKITLILIGIGLRLCMAQTALSLEACEKLFLEKNLLLLAEQYNISASRAAVIQAKIWELPYASTELNLINPQDRRVLDIGGRGQKVLAVEQLIYLGGKKKLEVSLAESNVVVAEQMYEELLYNLRFRLRQSFYELYFNQLKIEGIQKRLANIDTLTQAYRVQEEKGNVSLKDVVRLQSLALNFKSAMLEIQQNSLEHQQNLRILLNQDTLIKPVIAEDYIKAKLNRSVDLNLTQLYEQATQNNPEYLIYDKLIKAREWNVKWQKSLAKPDLVAGAGYDQRGGAFSNQINLTLAMPLHVWNKNKGNIALAEAELMQVNMQKSQKMTELTAQIKAEYDNILLHKQQYIESINTFQNVESVYEGMFQNFRKGNISLIEFTDFMESYNESTLYLNDIKKQLITSMLELNFLVNQEVL